MSNEELTIRDRLEDILESIELVAKLQKVPRKSPRRTWKSGAEGESQPLQSHLISLR
jgi:hypothetical protein